MMTRTITAGSLAAVAAVTVFIGITITDSIDNSPVIAAHTVPHSYQVGVPELTESAAFFKGGRVEVPQVESAAFFKGGRVEVPQVESAAFFKGDRVEVPQVDAAAFFKGTRPQTPNQVQFKAFFKG